MNNILQMFSNNSTQGFTESISPKGDGRSQSGNNAAEEDKPPSLTTPPLEALIPPKLERNKRLNSNEYSIDLDTYAEADNNLRMLGTPQTLSLKNPDTLFANDHPPCRVLVVGEPGVGKTAFIDALYSLVLNATSTYQEYQGFTESISPKGDGRSQPEIYQATRRRVSDRDSHENDYDTHEVSEFPSKTVYSKYIPIATGFELKQMTMQDCIRAHKFSELFIRFVTVGHGRNKIMAIDETSRTLDLRIKKNRLFDEIVISEYPSDINSIPEDIAQHFDKVIIMMDYSDITSMRSAQCWASTIKPSKKNTIICVNKCDVQAMSLDDDFQVRKAEIMNHFSRQCAVEYISVKTGANIGFIYKYL